MQATHSPREYQGHVVVGDHEAMGEEPRRRHPNAIGTIGTARLPP